MAFIGMLLGIHFKVFSMIGVSVLGAFGHALGQIVAAIILLETQSLIVYFPWLVALSIPTGILTGYVALKMTDLLRSAFFKETLN